MSANFNQLCSIGLKMKLLKFEVRQASPSNADVFYGWNK